MAAVWDQQANRARGGPPYARHRPEETLLYQVIDDYYPDFIAQLQAEGRTLPRFVGREFEDYLKCGRLEHGFLRVRCTACHAEKPVAFSCRRRGFCASCGARRMVESAALRVDEVLRIPKAAVGDRQKRVNSGHYRSDVRLPPHKSHPPSSGAFRAGLCSVTLPLLHTEFHAPPQLYSFTFFH
jgi:Transposase zinc-binding domain